MESTHYTRNHRVHSYTGIGDWAAVGWLTQPRWRSETVACRRMRRLQAGVADGWRLVTLKGNHDVMMADALRDPAKMASWIEKGGDAALASYGGDPAAVPPAHLAWLDGLLPMYADRHRVYVHAGLDPALPLDQQSEATLLWKRYPKGFSGGHGERHVVHGHDNFPEGLLLLQGRTNLDALAWRTGRLVIGVFDDDRPGGPVDFIVVKGEPAGR